MLVATCYEQPVLVLLEQLVASVLPSSTLQQGDNNMCQTRHNNWKPAMRTHPDISFKTTLTHLAYADFCNATRAESKYVATLIKY